MNNLTPLPEQLLDSFTDKVEQLFHELELAVMWQQPSFLFSVYHSEAVRKDAETLLALKLASLNQRITTILLDDATDLEALPGFFLSPEAQQTIFFVRGMVWDCSQDSVNVYKEINKYQELFPDNSIRVVFWIMEKEMTHLITCAPEYWNFRHRAIDFTNFQMTDEQLPKQDAAVVVEPAPQALELEHETVRTEAEPADVSNVEEVIAENANYLLTLGISHWRENNYEEALKLISVAQETAQFVQDPWFKAQCYHALALVKNGMGKYEEAISAYKQAVSLAPDRIFPWDNLGQLYCRLDRLQEAVSAYEKAIEHNPEDPFSWNGLGNVYAKIGLSQNAIAAYQKAIKISPDFANAHTGQGDVYARQGSWNEAIKSYQQAINLNPRLISPWISLGNVLQKKEQYEKAIHSYRNAITLDPKIVHVWNELGNAYLKIDAYEEAISAYEKVIELNPRFGWPYANLAFAYYKNGDHARAVPLYEKSIELMENDNAKAVSWNRLGDAYRQLKDYKNALQAYKIADQLLYGGNGRQADDPESPEDKEAEAPNQVIQAVRQASRDEMERTVKIPKAVLESDTLRIPAFQPDETAVHVQNCDLHDACQWNVLGNTHLRSGSYDEAIAAFQKAIELSPDAIWPYINNLALAYLRKGKQNGSVSLDTAGEVEVTDADFDNTEESAVRTVLNKTLQFADEVKLPAARPTVVLAHSTLVP